MQVATYLISVGHRLKLTSQKLPYPVELVIRVHVCETYLSLDSEGQIHSQEHLHIEWLT